MNENEPEMIERDLQRLRPAKVPDELRARLNQGVLGRRAEAMRAPAPAPLHPMDAWRRWLRWLVPTTAAAAAVAALLVWRSVGLQPGPHGQPISHLASPALKADDVEIGRQLVAAFDAVGHLPDGEPVRFRCREWADEVVLHDSARGIVVEQRTPRLEIVAVNYETY